MKALVRPLTCAFGRGLRHQERAWTNICNPAEVASHGHMVNGRGWRMRWQRFDLRISGSARVIFGVPVCSFPSSDEEGGPASEGMLYARR